MRTVFSKRGAIILLILLVALFWVRPQAGRLRWRVSQSISTALGRPVQIGALHLRLLPRLGFELENLVVRDDPAFGSEPILRAPDVTAWLRVTSLLRGRIDVSSMSFTDASLNLTRNPQGKWNLEDFLQRASAISTAPTGSGKRESRPAFPYIETNGARINFKIGTEKTHFAFTDAQFALWQDSDNTWGLRFKARPIRTDANLTDTGLINLTGAWQRSAALMQTPFQFSFQWNQAQIGQVSKLIYGADKGWRGGATVFGTIAGTPEKLKITGDGSVDDFGRYDVLATDDLRLRVHCVAEYESGPKKLSAVNCTAPSGAGYLQAKGDASGWPLASYSFSVTATKVPIEAVIALSRHTGAHIPVGLTLGGTLNAEAGVSLEDNAQSWDGSGELNDLVLSSENAATRLSLARVPLSVVSDTKPSVAARGTPTENSPRVEIGPVSQNLGRPVPLQARVSLTESGYNASVRGDAAIKRLLQVAELLSIPSPPVSADGSSTIDLSINGDWNRTQRPVVLGSAQLRSVHAQVRGLSEPLEVINANLILDANTTRVHLQNATAAGATWRGTVVIPRPCPGAADCPFLFNLHSSEVNAVDLNSLINSGAGKSWYRFLTPGSNAIPYLMQARATGTVGIDTLLIGKFVATNFVSEVTLDEGKLALTKIRGQMLGGTAKGDWNADFSVRPPAYKGGGDFDGVSLGQVAALMHDEWIEGTGSAKYQFSSAGWGIQDLLKSAQVGASFTVRDPEFSHVVLTGKQGPLRGIALSGNMVLQDARFLFQDTKLMTPTNVYKLSGNASLTGELNLKISDDTATAYGLSGTIARTRVIPIVNTATQAALKP